MTRRLQMAVGLVVLAMLKMSIRTKLSLFMGILYVIAFGYSTSDVVDSVKKTLQSQNILTNAQVSAELLRTLLAVRLERGPTVYQLDADAVSDPYWAGIVTGYRTTSESGYAAITALLNGTASGPVAEAMEKVKSARELVLPLRRDADAATRLPKAQRDPALSAKLTTGLRTYLDVLTLATDAVDKVIQTSDAKVDQYLAIKRAAWIARVAAGGVAGRIQTTISSGKPWSLTETMEAAEDRGRMKRASDNLNEIMSAGQLSSRVTDAYQRAYAMNFTGQAADERKTLSDALSAGQPTGVPVKDLQDRDTKNQQAIVDLAYAALDEMVDRAASVRSDAQLLLTRSGAILVACLAMAVFSFYVIFRGIAGPLKAVARCVGELASGNLDTHVPFVGRNDEIGGIVNAVAVFKDHLLRNRDLEAATDLNRLEGERQRKKILSDLAINFESSVGDIVRSVASSATSLETAARSMSHSAVETSQRSKVVAAAAELAAGNVTMVASSAEELGASVDEISRRVGESSHMSGAAVKEATETAVIVRELSQSAGRINDVLSLISSIASQTNLLALNATIEAARAGEAGRGFAIVAAEVKELANQTAKATAEISEQVNAIQASTERAVTAIGGITSTIEMLNDGATLISKSIAEQGAATGEIVRNIGQASTGTSNVTNNITAVAHAAAVSGSSAEQVLVSSAELAQKAEQMRAQVDMFLGNFRAA